MISMSGQLAALSDPGDHLTTSRRNFLCGLGAGLLAAPFTRLITGTALASGADAKRLLVFFTPNGTVPDRLWPTGSETSFSFPADSIFEPLAPIQDKVTILKGLRFHEATNHEGGMAAMLTNGGGETSETQGRSLDQVVAQHIGGSTRFPSLEFGVQTSAWGGNVQTRMCYSGPGSYVTPDDNPVNVFDRMFGDLVGGDDALAQLRARRQSIIDVGREELLDLHSRVGVEERLKLEAHVESLYSMEQGLQSSTTCEPGAAPSFPGGVYSNDAFPAVGLAQMDLAVSALSCGMTNVASIQWSHTVGPTVFSWLGLSEGHHSLSHIDDANQPGVDNYVLAERWFAEQFTYLVQQLDAQPDPEGDGSLLDSTVVLWAQELGDGRQHVCEDVPFVIAGAPGCFSPGRFLDLGSRNHAGLLVSISQAFGLPIGTFGNPAAGSGGIEELA